uniref:hypothetical protein n=1 Tax=Sphingomonas sp. H160509 TaxID=2955313 RepID=UPI0031590EB8
MHLARDPEQPGHCQRRDRHHDQLHRQLQAEDRRERHDQQVDAEVADHLPTEVIPLIQPGIVGDRQLDAVPAHMPGQVDQRRDFGPQQRYDRCDRNRGDECARLPPMQLFPLSNHIVEP